MNRIQWKWCAWLLRLFYETLWHNLCFVSGNTYPEKSQQPCGKNAPAAQWRGSRGEVPASNQQGTENPSQQLYEWTILEVDQAALDVPSDDYNPNQHLDWNLTSNPEPKTPSSENTIFFLSKMRIIRISTSLSYFEASWLYICTTLRIANTWLNCCCSGALPSIILLAYTPVQLCLSGC